MLLIGVQSLGFLISTRMEPIIGEFSLGMKESRSVFCKG